MKFHEAIRSDPRNSCADDFAELSTDQLTNLCKLMGIPFSGTKPQKIARLLSAADLRTILASYERPAQMVPFFSGATLRRICKQAGVYAGSTKYGMAAALLNWRNDCRERGQRYRQATIDAARQARELQPRLL